MDRMERGPIMTFNPERLVISGITQANPCVITTSTDHNLSSGQLVRVHVPLNYGMVELNNLIASIVILSATTFSIYYSQTPPVPIPVNSTTFNAFSIPSNPQFTAEIIPMGSGPSPITNTQWQVNNNFCDSLLGDATINDSTTPIPF